MGAMTKTGPDRKRRAISARRAIGFWLAILLATIGVIDGSDLIVRRSADWLDRALSSGPAAHPAIIQGTGTVVDRYLAI